MPATKTRRRRASSRRKPKSTRKPAARKATAKAAPAEPGVLARGREAAGRQLAGHGADVLAVCLFVLGAIFALGLWTDLAGPVGSALADGTGALLGRARVAVPVACFAFGVLLLWPRRSPDAVADPDFDEPVDDEPAERPTVRIAIGALLLVLADVGILHLAYGRPSLSGNLDDLRDAGGALGAMLAAPLVAATGVVGASIVLGGIALVGLLLALGISIGMIVAATSRASRTIATKARGAVSLAPIGEGVDLNDAARRRPRRGRSTTRPTTPTASSRRARPRPNRSRSPNPRSSRSRTASSRSRPTRTRAVSWSSSWATTPAGSTGPGSCRPPTC